MSVKGDIPQVRTPQDLERKYDLKAISNLKKETKINSKSLDQTQKELKIFVKSATKDLEDIRKDVADKVEIWFGSGQPTIEGYPTNQWEEKEYETHTSDLYYDTNTGYAYKFSFKDNVYLWEEIKDKDVIEALSIANAAKDTADGKRRIFTSAPISPYDNGDLWLKDGEILVCQISKDNEGEFEQSDFINATDYETSTSAKKTKNEINAKLEIISGKVTTVESNTYKKTEIEQILEGTYVDENGNEIVTKTVKTISGTFDENGMHYEKTGARTSSTINESGLSVDDIENHDELLFAGYDKDTKESVVRTENLKVKKYFVCGTYSRFEDYIPDNTDNGTGVYIL